MTSASATLVAFSVDDRGVATIQMRDMDERNALSEALVADLAAAVEKFSAMPDAKVGILIGTAEVFCSGAPKALLRKLAAKKVLPSDLRLPSVILDCPLPLIAAMEGHAVGGGLALGLCTDVVIMARESRYGCNFMDYGLTPGMGTTRLLEQILSPAVATELLFTGELRRGTQFAGNAGINHVLPKGDVLPKARLIAERIAEKPRPSLVLLKNAISARRRTIFKEAFEVERGMHEAVLEHPDVARLIENEYLD